MSSLSLMEWNGKHPAQWEWDNTIMVNAENPKKFRAADWEIDGESGVDSVSFNSSGGGSGSGGSGSDLGHTSLSKSSMSASINSSSLGDVKTSKFTLEASEAVSEDFNNKKELVKTRPPGGSPTLEASVGSGEPMLGLKLGKRTYFKDVCAGNSVKTSAFSVTPASSVSPVKRSKSSSQALNVPCCQVEGCNLVLSSAKEYHRKHKVCESHSKCPKVIVGGLERRFCQQCSRFHGLSEFDEKKRSCRRRLSDHNARRRKPQPESVQLNPASMPSSLYDERQPMNLLWNRGPLAHTSSNANFIWESTSNSKFTITKEYPLKAGQLHLTGVELTNSIPMHHCSSKGLIPSRDKSTTADVLNQGLEEPIISSNADATQDLQRALSLLSTSTWGSGEPKSVPLEHPIHKSHTSMPQPALQTLPQGLLVSSSEYWRAQQQPTDSQMHTLTSNSDGSSYFQEFQLLRMPYEGDFYSGQMN